MLIGVLSLLIFLCTIASIVITCIFLSKCHQDAAIMTIMISVFTILVLVAWLVSSFQKPPMKIVTCVVHEIDNIDVAVCENTLINLNMLGRDFKDGSTVVLESPQTYTKLGIIHTMKPHWTLKE